MNAPLYLVWSLMDGISNAHILNKTVHRAKPIKPEGYMYLYNAMI